MSNVVALHPPAPAQKTFTPNDLVEKLLALRAKIEEIKKRHKEELVKYNEAESYLENRLMAVLNENSSRQMRVDAGTFYTAKHISARVNAWSETLDYIRENDAWELLEARVNKTAVQALMEETNAEIPGVNVTTTYVLHVRKG
jgi:hypothetical protein